MTKKVRSDASFINIEMSLDRVEGWVEKNLYKGYEPFDGLTSFLGPLISRKKLPSQILQQVVRRFVINIRPLLGIKPLDSTKGRGYMAWGYLKRYQTTQILKYKNGVLDCLRWLDQNKSPFYDKHAWGNHFLYVSRGGFIGKHEPTIVWTGLIGQLFIEAYESFKMPRFREIIESITQWIMALPREHTDKGLCLSYIMPEQSSVHNSNMIGAAFLAGAAKLLNNADYSEIARQAMHYSCSRQHSNGSWYYSELPDCHWIDAFHTGYNLDSLKRYIMFTGDDSYMPHLLKGYEFFVKNFFEPTGRVKYFFNKATPTDIQCFAQAIDTLSLFSDLDPGSRSSAVNSACWAIENMQAKDGHFYFRKYPLGLYNKAPMIHWGQATMHKALAHLLMRRA